MTDRWAAYGGGPARPRAGWSFDAVAGPSRLGGANGIVVSPDGTTLLVTQVFGSQVTAIDVATGDHRPFAPLGEGIAAPDDGVFTADGTFFATEPMNATVSAKTADGRYRRVRDDLPAVNGIATDLARRRLFADEFRPGGRLWELDPEGHRPPRLLLDELMTPNALVMGRDAALWFPLVYADQVWRYDVEAGTASVGAGELDRPCAVKVDSAGRLLVAESGAGRITRIDPASGDRETVAQLARGIDNLAVGPGDRLFVSHFVDGRVVEVRADGSERVLSESGLVGPYGLALSADGAVWVADGLSVARLAPDGGVVRTHTLISDLPTLALDVAFLDGELHLLGQRGQVFRCPVGGRVVPVAGHLDEPVALSPGHDGELLVVERGAGRVQRLGPEGLRGPLVEGLAQPCAVAVDGTGTAWVATARGLVAVVDGAVEVELGELAGAGVGGVAVLEDGHTLIVTLPEAQQVVAVHGRGANVEVLVEGAPITSPVAGAPLPHAGAPLTATPGGGVLVGCIGDGSVRRLVGPRT